MVSKCIQEFRDPPPFKRWSLGNSLAVQWLGLWASTTGGTGSIPGRGTKIPHAARQSQKNIYIYNWSLIPLPWNGRQNWLSDWPLPKRMRNMWQSVTSKARSEKELLLLPCSRSLFFFFFWLFLFFLWFFEFYFIYFFIQQVLISYLFYTYSCICQSQSPNSSHHHHPPPTTFPPWCPHICSLHLCLYFCPANRFICNIFLGPTYMR